MSGRDCDLIMASEDTKPKVKAVVADGHTVDDGDGVFGPGEEVSLAAADVKQLRASGHLVDPAVKPPEKANGPTFTPDGGPMVKVAA